MFKLLDLFCGIGGAGMGYSRAGFEVFGVDHFPMYRYPFEHVQEDALEYLSKHGTEYDAIHASPPCQAYTWTRQDFKDRYPELIEPVRELLIKTGKPYVIENVVNAPLDTQISLCGTMFGLKLLRHRNFESNVDIGPLMEHEKHVPNGVKMGLYVTVAGRGGDNAKGNFSVKSWQDAMGIDWTPYREELKEAVPPAYTQLIGERLIRHLQSV